MHQPARWYSALFWIKLIDALFGMLPEDEHEWAENQTALMISFIAMRESAFASEVSGHRGGHKPRTGRTYGDMSKTLIIWQRPAAAPTEGG